MRHATGAVVVWFDRGRFVSGAHRRRRRKRRRSPGRCGTRPAAPCPGATVELRRADGAPPLVAVADAQGAFRFDRVAAGRYQATFTLINFASIRRDLEVTATGAARLDAVLHLSLSADVTVTGKRTFANLADVENPAENLVGIAESASQGAITARQLDARPIMRAGEVLETVPGVIISQHSGEGKANQYYLRGFNLDHGTDFATTVAGMPVNMPTHAHGQGYSDLNFLIPELVSGVQYSKGPYFADQGDFATAGSANINYASVLDALDRARRRRRRRLRARAAGRVAGGRHGTRPRGARSRAQRRPVGASRRLPEGQRRPALQPRRRGQRLLGHRHGLSRDVELHRPGSAARDRRGASSAGSARSIRPTAATPIATAARSSGSASQQQRHAPRSSRYGIGYDLNLFSNFTFFLDDPVHGDQFQQADHRFITGAQGELSAARPLGRPRGAEHRRRAAAQRRHHQRSACTTPRRASCSTRVRQDAVVETSGAALRAERDRVDAVAAHAGRPARRRLPLRASTPAIPRTAARRSAGIVSPKGGVVLGPFKGTEFYVNAGLGFHSNDARGTTITRDPATGEPVDPVTPLVRAKGAEVGIRTVAIPHLQTQPDGLDAVASRPSWCSPATPARPSRAGRATATASSSPTTTRRGRG